MKKVIVAGLCLAALGGCAVAPERAVDISQPKTPIVKTKTNFTQALRCMDDLLLAFGKRGILVGSDGIPDLTGKINAGTEQMVKTALQRMSTKSRAFDYINVLGLTDDRQTPSVAEAVRQQIGQAQELPPFFIEGAITQVDQNVARDGTGAGVGTPWVTLGYSEDQLLSIVSMDMRMGNTVSGRFLPGVFTTNTITVVATGSGADAEGVIKKGSVFLEVSQDRAEGTHQAVRTLVELGMIELVGKLTKVPYWRCLEIEATNPLVYEQARDWYSVLPGSERIEVVQAAMARDGLYRGPVDGRMTPEFREAVNRYKASRNLIADGRVDFDLYYQFLVENRAVAPARMADSGRRSRRTLAGDALQGSKPEGDAKAFEASFDPGPGGTSGRPEGSAFQGLTLGFVGGPRQRVRPGEALQVAVSVDREADVFCYYQFVEKGAVRVVRIFPNRWQPDGRLAPGQSVAVPGAGARFDLRPASVGFEEQIACVAREGGYTADDLPQVARLGDLAPLPVGRVAQAVDNHQASDQLQTAVRTLRWRVE